MLVEGKKKLHSGKYVNFLMFIQFMNKHYFFNSHKNYNATEKNMKTNSMQSAPVTSPEPSLTSS